MVKSASYHQGDGSKARAHLRQNNRREHPVSRLKPHWFPSAPDETFTGMLHVSHPKDRKGNLAWENKDALLKVTPSTLARQVNVSLRNQHYWIFLQDCLLISHEKKQQNIWLGDSLGAWQGPKVKQASHVNEMTTRLSVCKPQPSPCRTKHFLTMAAAFLWFVSQQVCSPWERSWPTQTKVCCHKVS